MPRYSEEFKYSMMMKMMPTQNQSVSEVAREIGLSEATLHKWRKQARAKGLALPGGEDVERWSTQDKFLIVLETAKLSEVELAEYCRSKGLFVEQVLACKDACMQANGGIAQQAARLQKELRQKDQQPIVTRKLLKINSVKRKKVRLNQWLTSRSIKAFLPVRLYRF